MTLGSVTVAWSLICDDASTNHTECTAVFTLPCDLLNLLILNPAFSVWQIDHAASALHWAHGKLRKVMRVARHCSVHVVAGSSALIQSHMHLLIILLISSTAFLHICRSITCCRNIGVVRESAPKLRLVAVSLSTTSVLALLVRLILSVRLLIVQYLNILIIIIIIWLLTLRLETVHLHARQRIARSLVVASARPRRPVDVVIRI